MFNNDTVSYAYTRQFRESQNVVVFSVCQVNSFKKERLRQQEIVDQERVARRVNIYMKYLSCYLS